MSDPEVDDYFYCPYCGQSPVMYQECDECEDGLVSLWEEDPINFSPDEFEDCSKCGGYGRFRWCPNCGYNLTEDDINKQDEEMRKLP